MLLKSTSVSRSRASFTLPRGLQIISGIRRIAYDLPMKLSAYFSQRCRIRMSKNYDVLGLKRRDKILIIAPDCVAACRQQKGLRWGGGASLIPAFMVCNKLSIS